MLQVNKGRTAGEILVVIVFYLLLFQNALEEIFNFAGYIDELFALIGVFVVCLQTVSSGKLYIKRNNFRIILLLCIFTATGLLANVLFRYQPIEAVLIDFYTNLKFFLSILTGFVIFNGSKMRRESNVLLLHARFASVLLAAFVAVDYLFEIFPSPGSRYGLRVIQLFFFHPTYLAAAAAVLMTVLLIFYSAGNVKYIALDVLIMASTLRSKALVGAIVYIIILVFCVIYRKKLKAWHIVLIGLVVIIVAGEQILYYFVTLQGRAAREILGATSLEIMRDYFPIGTGFGTFASNIAVKYYTPVYSMYGIANIHGLTVENSSFASDTFWPIIFGQTGLIGTVCYVSVLALLLLRIIKLRKFDVRLYAGGLWIFAYLLISSMAESAFCNPLSIPFAFLLGLLLVQEKQYKEKGLNHEEA
ncbi:MAG: hypothetical protein IJ412_05255 [Oscillospiraceae bacterium]|nr:hypothetical protein [Oscillospiraceae bacterium]